MAYDRKEEENCSESCDYVEENKNYDETADDTNED